MQIIPNQQPNIEDNVMAEIEVFPFVVVYAGKAWTQVLTGY